ncbi:hypothetical protein IW152_005834 [Coemansia sp. BCRC 34962]|nr:hypothetical protein IW152_005834 [Coemansia sp. BCRC 34962]
MTISFTGTERVILITGCSAGGIGHHLALELAAHGCRVFAGVRTPSKAQELAQNPRIEVIELDITSVSSVDAAIAYVFATTGGRIDMLVNNAGVLCTGPAVEVPLAQAQQVIDTNFVGLVRLCRAVAPNMMDRRLGTIVNIGSVCGYVASPWVSYYAASKAAVHAYSDALRMELAPFGVNVVVVAPGRIQSNIVSNSSEELLDASSTRYALALPAIEQTAGFSQKKGATSTSKFSRVVVPKILHCSPPAYITYGDVSGRLWCMYYVPQAIRDSIFGHLFGTHQLAKDLLPSSLPRPITSSVVVGVVLAAAVLEMFYVLF